MRHVSQVTSASLTTLNNQPADDPKVAWMDVLPVVAANQGDVTGQIYYDAGEYRLRPLPSWTLTLPVYDLTVDGANQVIYAATSQGVWSISLSDFTTSAGPWHHVGGLPFKVVRLSGVAEPDGAFYLYALVTGISAEADGFYQYQTGSLTPSDQTGVGYDHWVRFLPKERLLSAVATDGHSCFFLTTADQGASLWYYDGSNAASPYKTWSLGGSGVTGTRLDRVTVGSSSDSVWVALAGALQPAQYLLYSGTSWTTQPICFQVR